MISQGNDTHLAKKTKSRRKSPGRLVARGNMMPDPGPECPGNLFSAAESCEILLPVWIISDAMTTTTNSMEGFKRGANCNSSIDTFSTFIYS